MRRRQVFALTLLISLSGCGRDGGRGALMSQDLDALPPILLDEQLRLGSLDDPSIGFTRLADNIEVLADTLWIAEQSVPEIRVYAPDGRFVRSIGRRGAGPGELTSIVNWGIIGDTVWVQDLALSRISLFARDGSVYGTVPADGITVDIPPYLVTIVPFELRPDGRFNGMMIQYTWPGLLVRSTSELPSVSGEIPIVIFDPTGSATDTIGAQSTGMGPYVLPGVRREWVGTLEISPSAPLPAEQRRYSAGVDTIVVVQPAPEGGRGELAIHRLGTAGDTLFTRVLPYRPVPVSEQVRDSILEARVSSYRSRTSDLVGVERAVRNNTLIPDHYPPIAQARFGADGSIWMLRTEPGDVGKWVVLESDGAPRGSVEVRPRSTFLWSDGETAVFRELDDFDVPWVVRYRMR